MKKNIWIWNHYATNTIKDMGGRHYWIAENLIKRGFNITIFCASTIHNSDEVIDTNGKSYTLKLSNDVKYVVVDTPRYTDNGINRILNMITFYRKLFPTALNYSKEDKKPDIILASSVHPLTLVAGIKISKKFKVPCICEIRDLWPESIIADGDLKRNSIFAKVLYLGERWIYKKANKLIFTMEGGRDYIIDKGWDFNNGGSIDLNKVFHINNGVDIEKFNENSIKYSIEDDDLDDKGKFKVVYAGSVRKANEVESIIEIAKYIKKMDKRNIKFLIYGDGTERKRLEDICRRDKINNVVFKGKVQKQIIPYILCKSDLNIFHFKQSELKKYGASLNKLFEYFASGKPIISDCEFGYDLINKYKCGIVIDNGSPQELAEQIIRISEMTKEEYNVFCTNSIKASQDYDFNELTNKLIEIIELT